jgi:pyruvate dehydrogenase E2 component (dihydrolipoamide acetyltransferase)
MDVRLPRLGEGADSGVVASIFVKVGEPVKKDQPILELESEKAVASIPSPSSGVVTKIHVAEGDEVKVGQLVISLETNGAALASPGGAKQPIAAVEEKRSEDKVTVEERVETEGPEAPAELGASVAPLPAGIPPPASPSVRKLARELGVDLTQVSGSEHGGRIVLEDLKKYIQRLQKEAQQRKGIPAKSQAISTPAVETVDFSTWGPVTRKRMTSLRRTISNRMVASWSSIPHVTQFDEADVTGILSLRRKYGPRYEKKGAHLTLTSFALKAVVASLKKYPVFNASLDDSAGEIVFKNYYHIGIAVDTEQGLIVPVIREVDRKSLFELSVELAEIAERTRQRKLSLEEMQGGTFTISNQGGIGSAHFTPIINKPEVAILGMGRGALRPVIEKKKIVQRTMLPLGLSYDHRIIDGAEAARFMVDLVQQLEQFKDEDVKLSLKS